MSISRSRRTREHGQGSLETVSIVTIAALLVAATVGVVVQASPSIGEKVAYHICQIVSVATGGDCAAPSAPRAADDHLPDEPCLANSTESSAQVSLSFVATVKDGKTFLVEKMSDGSYRMTQVDLAGVGTGVGPGLDVSLTIDGKKYGVTAIASADVMIAAKKGSTWYAKDDDEADDLLSKFNRGNIVDVVAPDPGIGPFKIPNPINRIAKHFIADVGDPDEEFVEGGIEGSAEATVSGITASAGATVNAEQYLGAKKTPDGYTAYYRTAVSGEAYGAVIGQDASATAGGEMLSEISVDKSGTPTSIKFTAGVTLDASVEEDLTDDQKYTEYSYEVPLTGDITKDAEAYAALTGNPLALGNFIQRAKDDGYVTQNVYSQDPNTYGLNIGGELLGKYGGSISGDVTTRDLTESLYYDGNTMSPRPDC